MTQCASGDDSRAKLIARRQDAAQRRHLNAAKMLATIRKLLPPARSRAKTAKRDAGPTATAPMKREGLAGTVPVNN